MRAREIVRAVGVWVCLASLAAAQDQPYIVRPQVMAPIRTYMAPVVPPIRLTNSNRLYSLIRAGNLYLTLQDAIVTRWNPATQAWDPVSGSGGGPMK